MNDITDEEIHLAASNPSTIATPERAEEILGYLDEDIASIQIQLDAARIEAGVAGLSFDRREWLRRASNAMALKLSQRRAVGARLAEFRPPVEVPVNLSADRLRLAIEEAALLRQREKAEISRRNIELNQQRDREHAEMFLAAAKRLWSRDQNDAVWERAREMFPDSEAWEAVKAA